MTDSDLTGNGLLYKPAKNPGTRTDAPLGFVV